MLAGRLGEPDMMMSRDRSCIQPETPTEVADTQRAIVKEFQRIRKTAARGDGYQSGEAKVCAMRPECPSRTNLSGLPSDLML
jgi:hypothetical protein